jgi:raffinose/stachyose/melibiose transport system permease protein
MKHNFRIGLYIGKILIVLIIFIEIYPIFWLLMSSLKSTNEFVLSASYALPRGFYFQNYIDAWKVGRLNIYFRNSAIVTVVSRFLPSYYQPPPPLDSPKCDGNYVLLQ